MESTRQFSVTFLHGLLLLAGVLVAAPAVTAAPALQSLPSIEAAVGEFVTRGLDADEDLEFSIGRLDPRLRLPQCDQPLTTRNTHAARGNGPLSVEVRCQGTKPWVLYVPVRLSHYAVVAVTQRAIARDSVLGAADLKLERREVDNRHAGYLSSLEEIVGQMAVRQLRSGEIVLASQLKRPRLVRRGDQVTLRMGTTSVQVRARGEALADGAAGERIPVLNLSSERVIEGVVKSTGEVIVGAHKVL